MKVFHELAYEGFVLADGTGVGLAVFSDPRLMELIGAVDVAHVSGYSAQVTGTTPPTHHLDRLLQRSQLLRSARRAQSDRQ
jgi:hypothetical protein